jgi:hypothetical protein
MGQDAARAQAKMDGAILSKRIIKVDFAHQEKIFKTRKPAKDATQITTLSILKGSQHTRYLFACLCDCFIINPHILS